MYKVCQIREMCCDKITSLSTRDKIPEFANSIDPDDPLISQYDIAWT